VSATRDTPESQISSNEATRNSHSSTTEIGGWLLWSEFDADGRRPRRYIRTQGATEHALAALRARLVHTHRGREAPASPGPGLARRRGPRRRRPTGPRRMARMRSSAVTFRLTRGRFWRGLVVAIGQPCCVLGRRGAANSPHTVPRATGAVLLARSSEVPPVSGRDRVQNLPLVLPGRGVFPSG
jgi:hypothetical protein